MGLAQTRPRRCRRAPERCAERRRNLSGVRTRTGTLIDSAAVPPLREERPCAVAATSAGRHDDLRALRHALAHVATQHLAQERHRDPPLLGQRTAVALVEPPGQARHVAVDAAPPPKIGKAASKARVCQYLSISGVGGSIKKKN